jgi:hypothetical protein
LSSGTRWAPPLLVVTLFAAIVSAPSLANGFAYDDLPIVRDNSRVHALASLWSYAAQGYWPPEHGGFLYRPLTVWMFALQWAIGDGSPLVFHLGSVLLTVAVAAAVYILARQILPPVWACVAGTIFAVHPVHVEAVANVVGQAELLMGLAATSSVVLYVVARRRGRLGVVTRSGIALLAVAAAAAKEQGFIVPALLVLAELTILGQRDRQWRQLGALGVLLAAGLAGVLAARTIVLHGLGGGAPAAALGGLTAGERALTMLAMVPQFFRLMLWPAHLRADYSPPEFGPAAHLTLAHLAGVTLLGATALIAWRAWHAGDRGVGFGVGWTALALVPISNLGFPTGVLIAERTLLLPSVGVAVALACGARLLALQLAPRPRLRLLCASLGALALFAGGIRSAVRQRIWRDGSTLFPQMIADSPRSYRAHAAYARFLRDQGDLAGAEAEFRTAAMLYERDALVYLELGQLLRSQKRCIEAIPLFEQAAAIAGEFELVLARSRIFECRLALGDYRGARAGVAPLVASGHLEFARLLARADRAIARAADSASAPSQR